MKSMTTAAPGTGVADARRENPTDVQSVDAQTMEVENMGVDTMATETVDDDTLELETLGLRPAASAARREPNECHVLDLLIILSRRKQIILRTTLAAAVLAAIVSLLLPNRYTAIANILPPQQSPSLAASMIGQLGALGPMAAMAQKDLGLKNPNDLYVGMLRSHTGISTSGGTLCSASAALGLIGIFSAAA